MNFRTAVKRLLICTCACYTVLTVALNLFALASSKTGFGLDASKALLILLFSVLFGVAELIRKLEKPSAIVRYLLHGGITVASFYLCILLPSVVNGNSLSSGTVFVMIVLLMLAYAVIYGITALICAKLKKGLERAQKIPYTPQYKKGSGRS